MLAHLRRLERELARLQTANQELVEENARLRKTVVRFPKVIASRHRWSVRARQQRARAELWKHRALTSTPRSRPASIESKP
jgi:dynactin complex subunit